MGMDIFNLLAGWSSIISLLISIFAIAKVQSFEKRYNLKGKQIVKGNENIVSGGDTNVGK